MKLKPLLQWFVSLSLILASAVLSGAGAADQNGPVAIDDGGHVGNGGDSVVCFKTVEMKEKVKTILIHNTATKAARHYPDDAFSPDAVSQITSVEMYDLWLAERAGDEPIGIIDANDPWQKIVENRLSTLRRKSDYYQRIEESRKALNSRNWLGAESGVVEIYDGPISPIMDPKCLVVQIAIQESGQVTYAKNLYDIMGEARNVYDLKGQVIGKTGPVHQAALRWHEYAMNHLRNARQVQREVGLVFSSDFDAMPPQEVGQELASMQISAAVASAQDSNVLGTLLVWSNGSNPSSNFYRLVTPREVSFPQGFKARLSEIQVNPSQNRITAGLLAKPLSWGDLEAPESANIASLEGDNPQGTKELVLSAWGIPSLRIRGLICDASSSSYPLTLYSSGHLRGCYTPENSIRLGEYLVNSRVEPIQFQDAPGDLKIWKAVTAEGFEKDSVKVLTGSSFELDPQGRLVKAITQTPYGLPSGTQLTSESDHQVFLTISYAPAGAVSSVQWRYTYGLNEDSLAQYAYASLDLHDGMFNAEIDPRQRYLAYDFAEFYIPSGYVKRTRLSLDFDFRAKDKKGRVRKYRVQRGSIVTLDEEGFLIAIDGNPPQLER